MNARRAVSLKFAVVVALLAAAVAGFLALREYDDVSDRASTAERQVRMLRARATRPRPRRLLTSRAAGRNSVFAGIVEGVDVAGGRKPAEPGWYAVRVVPNRAAKTLCCRIDQSLKLEPCRDYYWTSAAPRALRRSGEPSDPDCP